jgi:hypothetical protein
MITLNKNNAWDRLQDDMAAVETEARIPSTNIEYHAQRYINAYVAALVGQPEREHWRSCYYQVDHVINGLPVTVRVANHRGYSDAGYKRAHGNTGIEMFDTAIQATQPRYIVSVEVLQDRERRYGCYVHTDTEENVTRIELVNVNDQYRLEEMLSCIDSEFSDLF